MDLLRIIGFFLLFVAPIVAVQFFCCFLKPVALKFIPLGIDLLLWPVLRIAGFEGLWFLWLMVQVLVVSGIGGGWALYGLLMQWRSWKKEPATRAETRWEFIFLIAMVILVLAGLLSIANAYVQSLT